MIQKDSFKSFKECVMHLFHNSNDFSVYNKKGCKVRCIGWDHKVNQIALHLCECPNKYACMSICIQRYMTVCIKTGKVLVKNCSLDVNQPPKTTPLKSGNRHAAMV